MGKSCCVKTIRRVLREQDVNFWDTLFIILAYESEFDIFDSDGMSYVWRKLNTELQKGITEVHGGGSVMVRTCMSASGVGNLVLIEEAMQKTLCLNILKNNLSQSAEKFAIRDELSSLNDTGRLNHLISTSLTII